MKKIAILFISVFCVLVEVPLCSMKRRGGMFQRRVAARREEEERGRDPEYFPDGPKDLVYYYGDDGPDRGANGDFWNDGPWDTIFPAFIIPLLNRRDIGALKLSTKYFRMFVTEAFRIGSIDPVRLVVGDAGILERLDGFGMRVELVGTCDIDGAFKYDDFCTDIIRLASSNEDLGPSIVASLELPEHGTNFRPSYRQRTPMLTERGLRALEPLDLQRFVFGGMIRLSEWAEDVRFPSSLRALELSNVPASDWLAFLIQVSCPHLQTLSLASCLDEGNADWGSNLPSSLKRFELCCRKKERVWGQWGRRMERTGTWVPGDCLGVSHITQGAVQLREFRLSQFSGKIEEVIEGLPNTIRVLEFDRCPALGIDALRKIRACFPDLESLVIDSCEGTDFSCWKHLPPGLRQLHLLNWSQGNDGMLRCIFQRVPHLEVLAVSGCLNLTKEPFFSEEVPCGLRVLSLDFEIAENPRDLNLDFQDFFEHIALCQRAKSHYEKLTDLTLRHCYVTAKDMMFVPEKLVRLNLDYCNVPLRSLSCVKIRCERLRKISLRRHALRKGWWGEVDHPERDVAMLRENLPAYFRNWSYEDLKEIIRRDEPNQDEPN